MTQLPPRTNPTDTRVPYTPILRSPSARLADRVRRVRAATGPWRLGRRRRREYRLPSKCFPVASLARKRDDRVARVVTGASIGLDDRQPQVAQVMPRSEEHTSELQSLMRNSYAVFCLKKNNHS